MKLKITYYDSKSGVQFSRVVEGEMVGTVVGGVISGGMEYISGGLASFTSAPEAIDSSSNLPPYPNVIWCKKD